MNEDQHQHEDQHEDLNSAIAAAIARRQAGRYDIGHVEIDPDVEASVRRIRRARNGL